LNIFDQLLQGIPTVDAQSTLSGVGIGSDDLNSASLSVPADCLTLILGGVTLVIGRHSYIFGCANRWRQRFAFFSELIGPFCHYTSPKSKEDGSQDSAVCDPHESMTQRGVSIDGEER